MLTQSQTDTLNLIRWLSTIAIVACHILQGYDNEWAWVLNIGVQVFFFLSGFLYGIKSIVKIKRFYFGRFIKLYLPYIIWVTIAIGILSLISPDSISYKGIILQYATLTNLPGLNHLWFMNIIFICYLILPIIDRGIDKYQSITILSVCFIFVLILALKYESRFLWISLYYLGYFCGKYQKIQKYTLLVAAVVSVWMVIYSGFTLSIFKEHSILNNILHATMGITIFLCLFLCGSKITYHYKISQFLTNRGGYEVYLTHHLFILGPVSLLFITPNTVLNVSLILIITFICSYGLLIIGSVISKKTHKYFRV